MNLRTKLIRTRASQDGFTLIELLVVIGILAILLAITLIAINPNKHFQDARNTQRKSDVSAILDAVYEYESANTGSAPSALANVSSTAASLSRGAAQAASAVAFSTPSVTFTVGSGNTVTSGMATVSGCSVTADNGTFPVTGGSSTTIIVTNAAGVAGATGCSVSSGVNLCTSLAPTYIADLPMDPSGGSSTGGATPCNTSTTAYNTGYTISASGGRFTVSAPSAEGGSSISVTR